MACPDVTDADDRHLDALLFRLWFLVLQAPTRAPSPHPRARSDGVPVLACLGCRLAETGGPVSRHSLSVCTEVRGIHHTSRKTLKTFVLSIFTSHRRRGTLSRCDDACNRRRGELFQQGQRGPRPKQAREGGVVPWLRGAGLRYSFHCLSFSPCVFLCLSSLRFRRCAVYPTLPAACLPTMYE